MPSGSLPSSGELVAGTYSIVRMLSPVFYAIGANRVPVAISVMAVLLNAALSLTLVLETPLSYRGLPLATSVAALFNAGALMFLLRRRLSGMEGARLTMSVLRITTASALMGGAAFATDRLLASSLPDGTFTPEVLRLMAAIGAGLVVLALSAHVLRIRELQMALAALRRWLPPKVV
jgi:putative peptidoglycan lipid II flippase